MQSKFTPADLAKMSETEIKSELKAMKDDHDSQAIATAFMMGATVGLDRGE